MRIRFIEIQNFRKLKTIRIDFADATTVFVGANNSGKTSAMVALGHFLVDHGRFTINDFTLSNLSLINKIGAAWQEGAPAPTDVSDWQSVLPSIDVWLDVGVNEIHYVNHLLPTLDWNGGMLGVRLRLEPKDIEKLHKEFLQAVQAASETKRAAEQAATGKQYKLSLWPHSMKDFLDRRLKALFEVHAYLLDPAQCKIPTSGIAFPQALSAESEPLEGDPFKGLFRVDEINAQRGFADAGGKKIDSEAPDTREKRRLTEQLRSYYSKHLDPTEMPEPSDIDALQAIDDAQVLFDARLQEGFAAAFGEVEGLGYPGVTDPRLTISTRIKPTDGLDHDAAVQYEVISQPVPGLSVVLRLPEEYNGLGYQNLISIVFRLMSFRDGWMQVGKASKKAAASGAVLPPLHLVLVEEPEAHLHAQVQQVFIRKAYEVLRAHPDLRANARLATQLIVSTHSSHVAHECEFSCLRYFRRLPAIQAGDVPTSTVINLSEVFGSQNQTQRFVTRYLKATHCDLFFADAAILVEGAAERMLVPHFIKAHYTALSQRYISILEIGGSHAHQLRQLIEHLGLTTLVVTDLDAKKGDGTASPPVRAQGLLTRNATLKNWVPKKESIDELLDAAASEKEMRTDRFFAVRVAYQRPVSVVVEDGKPPHEALPNTFEDALVFENISTFKTSAGAGLIGKFRALIAEHPTVPALGAAMFSALKTGEKAKFALDLIYEIDPGSLTVPTYIGEGLTWLQEELNRKQSEVLPLADVTPAPAASI